MPNFKFTLRGKLFLATLLLLFLVSVVKGNVYFMVYMFLFCAISFSLLIYEVYFNK